MEELSCSLSSNTFQQAENASFTSLQSRNGKSCSPNLTLNCWDSNSFQNRTRSYHLQNFPCREQGDLARENRNMKRPTFFVLHGTVEAASGSPIQVIRLKGIKKEVNLNALTPDHVETDCGLLHDLRVGSSRASRVGLTRDTSSTVRGPPGRAFLDVTRSWRPARPNQIMIRCLQILPGGAGPDPDMPRPPLPPPTSEAAAAAAAAATGRAGHRRSR